jgi:hypothetical protein
MHVFILFSDKHISHILLLYDSHPLNSYTVQLYSSHLVEHPLNPLAEYSAISLSDYLVASLAGISAVFLPEYLMAPLAVTSAVSLSKYSVNPFSIIHLYMTDLVNLLLKNIYFLIFGGFIFIPITFG